MRLAVTSALCAGFFFSFSAGLHSQAARPSGSPQQPLPEPTSIAQPLAEDRGSAGLEQACRRLQTTASVLMIVAHPDDEDGALLTYLSRGLGARVTLLSLTRGEGGQNAMSAESDDALGLIRTQELLRADQFYGANQLWGTEADFGFSKTQQESFARWGHERVLYDAVLAIRQVRPQVIVGTFVGAVSDGHGQHQVSGEIAQEAFHAAADPKIFPDQLKPVHEGGLGLAVWQPLAVYSMVPFAQIENGKIFDYATGKWAAARLRNYVTGEWLEGQLPADARLDVGQLDPVLGRGDAQIAREGWGEQKSQNGGANPTLSGPQQSRYHLWAVAPQAAAKPGAETANASLFSNAKVSIDTSLGSLAQLASSGPVWLSADLKQIAVGLTEFEAHRRNDSAVAAAHRLAPAYGKLLALRARLNDFFKQSPNEVPAAARATILLELDEKIAQAQTVLTNLLGLDLAAFTAQPEGFGPPGPFRGAQPDETAPSVTPGEQFRVRVHTAQSIGETRLNRVWLESTTGEPWETRLDSKPASGSEPAANPVVNPVQDQTFLIRAAEDAEPTRPYFTRLTTEQPYYDIERPELRLRSFAPYPLNAWAEFVFDGQPIRLGLVVQTLQRRLGPGGQFQPLVVTPSVGVRVEPTSRILPLDGSPLPVRVTVHTQSPAEGSIHLELPSGWKSEPAESKFVRKTAGDTEPIEFRVTPSSGAEGAFAIRAVAQSGGKEYRSGWQSAGYPGLRPSNLYRVAELKTRRIDAHLVPGLHIGYVMGTGDTIPEAIEALGARPHLLTAADLTRGDLAAFDTIVLGIRAYSARPELAQAQPRLDQWVRQGGTLVVQYQSGPFPSTVPLTLGRMPERVVDEETPVQLLVPADPLLSAPNRITAADFDHWAEERGHSFLASWDASFTALTETADAGQDPQRGGLVVSHPGRGVYIYCAFALHRQTPELVPGAYRLLANLLSAGHGSAAR